MPALERLKKGKQQTKKKKSFQEYWSSGREVKYVKAYKHILANAQKVKDHYSKN